MKKLVLVIAGVVLLGGAVFAWQNIDREPAANPTLLPRMYGSFSPTPLPADGSIGPAASPSRTPISSTGQTGTGEMSSEVNLAVPFTIQAPHQNWKDPYGDFCEEASVLMAASYIKGLTIPNPDFADQKLLEIMNFELQRFGYHKDTNAEETAVILKEFYDIDKVKTVYEPTPDDIKRYLAEGKIIIIPAAGRLLGNPNFTGAGPLYHMLVIKGYTREGNFITNDPGTRKGADYIYSPDVIMNAIHDWNGGDVYNGRKVIIVVG